MTTPTIDRWDWSRIHDQGGDLAALKRLLNERLGKLDRTIDALTSSVQIALGFPEWYNVGDYGIATDGTDQTAALVALFATLPFSAAEFGGIVYIPYGVRFNYMTVTLALPIGAQLIDFSTINYNFTGVRTGLGTGYKHNTFVFGSRARTNDDQSFVLRSGHHPTLVLHNLGNSTDAPAVPTPSALARKATIAYAVDQVSGNDPLYAFYDQFRVSTAPIGAGSKWVRQLRSMSSYAGFLANINTANRDGLIFEIDEDGEVSIGRGDSQDGVMLLVQQSPFRNGGADTETDIILENTNNTGVPVLRMYGRDAGGVLTGKLLRVTALNHFELRSSDASSVLWDVSNVGDGTVLQGLGVGGASINPLDTIMLDVQQRGAASATDAVIRNNNLSSYAYLRLYGKDGAGVVTGKLLRAGADGLLAVRKGDNSASLLTLDDDGTTTITGDINSVGVKAAIAATSTDLTLTAAHYMVLVDATGAARTITLPAAASHAKRVYIIKKTDASGNTVTIDGNGAETIDGAATKVLAVQYASATIQSDGSNWWVQ